MGTGSTCLGCGALSCSRMAGTGPAGTGPAGRTGGKFKGGWAITVAPRQRQARQQSVCRDILNSSATEPESEVLFRKCLSVVIIHRKIERNWISTLLLLHTLHFHLACFLANAISYENADETQVTLPMRNAVPDRNVDYAERI